MNVFGIFLSPKIAFPLQKQKQPNITNTSFHRKLPLLTTWLTLIVSTRFAQHPINITVRSHFSWTDTSDFIEFTSCDSDTSPFSSSCLLLVLQLTPRIGRVTKILLSLDLTLLRLFFNRLDGQCSSLLFFASLVLVLHWPSIVILFTSSDNDLLLWSAFFSLSLLFFRFDVHVLCNLFKLN